MTDSRSQSLREEFNRWAEAGRGDSMETDHNVLDVGSGSGWLSRRVALQVPEGRVVGMDISDEMIRVARRNSADHDNILYVVAEAAEIPWEPNFFDHAISVESAYYWPDPAAGIRYQRHSRRFR